jgi:nucleotidyltransferase/DNA polymerase involved in DNA repair
VSRRLLYVEVPGFYAAVERAANPGLGGRPLIVGGDPRKRGIVQAATPDALEAGVEEGMQVLDALARCPRARALRTDMPRYREAAKRLRACLRRVSERLEPEGLGAAILEVTERLEPSSDLARGVREHLSAQMHLNPCVGVAPVRFVAQVAARESGSEGFRVVEPGEVARFLAPLPAQRLPGVGPNTLGRLNALGLRTAGDVALAGREVLEQQLGNHGLGIWAAAMGQGSDRVRTASHLRTVSQERTLPGGERDRSTLSQVLGTLSDRVAHHLELEGLETRRLILKLRFSDGDQITRTRSRDRALADPAELLVVAEELLERAEVGERALRLLGLSATRLTRRAEGDAQLPLFAPGE